MTVLTPEILRDAMRELEERFSRPREPLTYFASPAVRARFTDEELMRATGAERIADVPQMPVSGGDIYRRTLP